MTLTRARSGVPGGVMFVQVLPASRVMWTSPSSDPVQIVSASRRDGAIVKIVAKISGSFMSCVIGPPDSPSVFGSCFVRSGLIYVQLWPSFVVLYRNCDDVSRTFESNGENTI